MLQKYITNGVKFHQSKVTNVVHEVANSIAVCINGVKIQASVVLDATGFSLCLSVLQTVVLYHVAYGIIIAEVDGHPINVDKMVVMDWRDVHFDSYPKLKERHSKIPTFLNAMPFSAHQILPEETTLVARPVLRMEDIQERMVARLKDLGINIKRIEEDERCLILMGGTLPVLPQRVVRIGGKAGMVHPSTGYMVVRTPATSTIVENYIARFLRSRSSNISERR